MDRLKTLSKYAIWVILFFLFSTFISYIGLNARYKNLELYGEVPGGVKINMAQTTSVNGRILGEVTSTENNDLNGKYLKVDIFSKRDELIGTKYLKLENLNLNEPKKFAVYYSAENVKNFTVDIQNHSEELERENIRVRELYNKIFRNEDMPLWLIVFLVAYALAP